MPAPDYENDLVFPPRHDKTAYELQLENNKLRGLLEECKPALSHLGKWSTQRQDLLTRINAALGESEKQ